MSPSLGIGDVHASWGGEGGAWDVLVHGGAGRMPRRPGDAVRGCRAAAAAAAEVLRAGGRALDAVERAVAVLEDDPCFNAGTGACLNADGRIELDAAIMEGGDLRAGAVCALPPFLHPIAIARAALDDGRHVLYAGEGAARFARERGFAPSTLEAMTTSAARADAVEARENASRRVPGDVSRTSSEGPASGTGSEGPTGGGTVGAVARDALGHVASATSTGGLVGKHPGRVGDSPLLGAGTYADDDGGACSATGLGEAIMRIGLAKTASDLMRARVDPEEAARAVIRSLGRRAAGTGGVILVDRHGRMGLARNTPAMTWAAMSAALGEAFGG